MKCYAIVDNQSNSTFADPRLLDFFNIKKPTTSYTLTTLSGEKIHRKGRVVKGLRIRGVTEKNSFPLPTTLENDMIPDTRDEVATPEDLEQTKHLAKYAHQFTNVDRSADVLLLIGRDAGELLSVKQEGAHYPYALKTPLGWAVVGTTCQHATPKAGVKALRTAVEHDHFDAQLNFGKPPWDTKLPELPKEDPVFSTRSDDEQEAPSLEDERFLRIISNGVHVNEKGNLEMPLPFKRPEASLPSNQAAVYRRTKGTLNRLRSDKEKLEPCLKAMGKTLAAEHIERVPCTELNAEKGKAWWLPVFPVTHPKKGKVRLVFDSSAVYHGTCLNDQLLQGPDQNNRLR